MNARVACASGAGLLAPDVATEDPELLVRFVREGEILRRLDHPNIVKLIAAVPEGGRQYIIMEYVAGGSLRDLLSKQPKLPDVAPFKNRTG